MSFDLFVICPSIDREVAARFNELERPGLPLGLSIDLEQCADDSRFWTINQNGEEWAELYINRDASRAYPHRPADIDAGWVEIHLPSRGHPMVFPVVAALAEVAKGWAFDPQGAATEVALQVGDDQARNVEHGF